MSSIGWRLVTSDSFVWTIYSTMTWQLFMVSRAA